MKVGDLVRLRHNGVIGLVIYYEDDETALYQCMFSNWRRPQWIDCDDVEVISESR